MNLKSLIFFIIFLNCLNILAQDSTSLAYKKNKPRKRSTFFYQPDLSYQIWKQFHLIKEANAGDPLAQHELGIRYLLGEELPADTILGAYWIQRAAMQKLPAACFNYGILLLNGWGAAWNPFEAYKNFLIAANDSMAQAEYIIGLLYTDNLVVKKDWNMAYNWLKRSAEKNFTPANEVLKELKSKISVNDSIINPKNGKKISEDNNLTGSLGLVFIDFENISDSIPNILGKDVLESVKLSENDSLIYALKTPYNSDSSLFFEENDMKYLLEAADFGSPEALTYLGWIYENGEYTDKDLIKSIEYYIKAFKLESPHAPGLLWKLLKNNPDIINSIEKNVKQEDAISMFIWYSLYDLGLENRFPEQDAVELLKRSAEKKYMPAIVELGSNYYSGKYVGKDTIKAVYLWKEAKDLGSVEAELRIAALLFQQGKRVAANLDQSLSLINNAKKNGSILAQALLAVAFEKGYGVKINKGESVKQLRNAAHRGSRFAYEQLKRLYNEIRPLDRQFEIN